MKLDVISATFFHIVDGFFVVFLNLYLVKGQKHFQIPRLGNQPALPARMDKILVAAWAFLFTRLAFHDAIKN